MAKFRNLLVHFYWNVNDEEIYKIIQTELDDFSEFIRQISIKYL